MERARHISAVQAENDRWPARLRQVPRCPDVIYRPEPRPGLDPPQEEHTAPAWGGWGVGTLCRSVRPGQGAHIQGRAPAQDPKRTLLRGRLGSESTMGRPLSQPGPGASCPPHSGRPEPPCPAPPTRPAGLSGSAAGRGSPSAFPPGLPAPEPTAGPGCRGLSEGLASTGGGGADAQKGSTKPMCCNY